MTQTDFDKLRSASSVDVDALRGEWDSSTAKALMKDELIAMTKSTNPDESTNDTQLHEVSRHFSELIPQTKHKRNWKLAAVAAAVTALVVLGGLNPFGTNEVSAVRNLPDGGIIVDWATDFADADNVARQLKTFGVDVDIIQTPSSPSAVGTVVSSVLGATGEATNQLPEGLTVGPDGSDTALQWTIDPQKFTETITLHVGVTPDNGVPYAVAEEAFEPGEILENVHCVLPSPLSAAALAPTLASLNLNVVWEVVIDVDSAAGTYSTINVTDRVPSGNVLSAYSIDANSIRIEVLPDQTLEIPGMFEPRLSDFHCP